jgi:hypothetical protein
LPDISNLDKLAKPDITRNWLVQLILIGNWPGQIYVWKNWLGQIVRKTGC